MLIGFCCKKPNFGDDHVDADEERPTIFYDPDEPGNGNFGDDNYLFCSVRN